ncbi:MAG: hypothetical protein L0G99_09830 [Propionibacteriales bacterium]|nr:hypothetical protein [Propionibacteriales bacterium]
MSVDRAQAIIDLSYLPPELSAATRIATRDCLVDKGYPIPFNSGVQPRRSDVFTGIPGVFYSREDARTGGYATTSRTSDPIATYQESLPSDQREKLDLDLLGDPAAGTVRVDLGGATAVENTSGCRAEAFVAVFGDVRDAVTINNFETVLNIQSSSLGQSRTAAVQRALPEYRSCMKQAGYEVATDTLGAERLAESMFGVYRNEGEPPNTAEQRLATTDYDCQTQSKVREGLLEVFAAQGGAWVVEHEGEVQAMQGKVRESMQRARAIIDG